MGDDKYFHTLEPGVPVTFSHRFAVALSTLALPEGHRYRFSVRERETLKDWWYGRRKDVMTRPGFLELLTFKRRHRPLLKASGEPIDIALVTAPVEFEILHQKCVEE